ncbi:DUF2298 domain-containing protein, partial [Dehalococcoidia bacterium]|nr:DUF2298 domain-containing protein [Dehalococcoidia bacterium]
MLDAFVWWLTSFAIGLVALPITCRLFRWLPDQGYAFGRPLGILLFSYIFWVLGMANVLPNDRLGVAVSLLLVIAVAAWVAVRNRKALLRFVVSQWRVILITEMVFIVIFVVWGLVRSYTPTIAHTEQPMDFALLNAILVSPEFPPSDPWFSGEPISYYYFGYLMHAGLTTLTGIPSSISYNLALMSTAAMTATGIMSLVYNLVRSVRRVGDKRASAVTALGFGLAAVLLMLFLGNLVGALEFLRVNNVGSVDFYRWVDIDGLLGGVGSSTWYPSETWWWWRSTRVINTFTDGVGIDYTITEFPFFSFLLGDLHPHVMALPFTLLALAVSCSLFRMPAVLGIRWIRDCPGEVLLCTLIFGSLGFLNSWDLPTFIALLSFVLLLKAFYAYPAVKPATMMSAGLLIAFMVLGSLALYLPFYLDLETQASGLLPVRRTM